MPSVFYGRVAVAYVQGFGLKAIAPFCIERFETPGHQTLTTLVTFLLKGGLND